MAARFKPIRDLAWQTVGPLTVVIDLGRGRSLGLNETAGLVWTLLSEMDDEQIAGEVARRYGIEPARAQRDVTAILTTLRERGLLEEA